MKLFQLSIDAETDLLEIWSYIYPRSPLAADKLENEILDACEKLGSHPGIGHARPDLTRDPTIRFYPVRGTYLIIYEALGVPIMILRVLHSSRDAATELRS